MRLLPVKPESNRDSQDKKKDDVSEIPTIKTNITEAKDKDTVSDTVSNKPNNTDNDNKTSVSKDDSSTNSDENSIEAGIEVEVETKESNLLGDGSDESDVETDEFGFEILQ